MKKLNKLFAVLSTAALAASMLAAVPVSAEGANHTVTFDYNGFGKENFTVEVAEGAPLATTVRTKFEDGWERLYGDKMGDDKVLRGWCKSDDTETLYSFEDLTSTYITEDTTFLAVWQPSVIVDGINITIPDECLPKVGETIPSDIRAKVQLPEDIHCKVNYALYTPGFPGDAVNDYTKFENDRVYVITISLIVEDGYGLENLYDGMHFSSELPGYARNIKVNGIDAAVSSMGNTINIMVCLPLGEVNTHKLTMHYGLDSLPDKTFDIYDGLPNFYQNYGPYPVAEGYSVDNVYVDPEFSRMVYGNEVTSQDSDLYVRWYKLIDEVNLTVDSPKCGATVGAEAGSVEMQNEPNVTCDVEGINFEAFWAEIGVDDGTADDVPMKGATYLYSPYNGVINADNDYRAVIKGESDNNAKVIPYFKDHFKITLNGEALPEPKNNVWGMVAGIDSSTVVSDIKVVTQSNYEFSLIGTVKVAHQWSAGVVTKAADCAEKGIMTYTCEGCHNTETEEIEAIGHEWGEWTVVKAATETEEGTEERVCKHNAAHKETRAIAKLTPASSSSSSAASSSSSSAASSSSSKKADPSSSKAAATNTGNSNPATGATATFGTIVLAAAAAFAARRKNK